MNDSNNGLLQAASQRPQMPLTEEGQAERDRRLVEQNELEIQAMLHDVWMRQLQHRRGPLFAVRPTDVRALQLMQQALESIQGASP